MATLGQIIFYSMITLIILFSTVIILILSVTLTGGITSIRTTSKFPVANLGKEKLLSCYVKTYGSDVDDMSFTWTKTGSTGTVYQYSDGAEDLSTQNAQFKGRTRLFTDSVDQGNASLLLRNVKKADEGEYKCSVTSSEGSGDVTVHLRTAAFSAPSITFSSGVLRAEAQRWSPKPAVTWTDSEDNTLEAETVFTEGSGGIFSLSSSVNGAEVGSSYTCNIQNDLVTSVSEATPTVTGLLDSSYFVFSSSTSRLAPHLSVTAALLCLLYVT